MKLLGVLGLVSLVAFLATLAYCATRRREMRGSIPRPRYIGGFGNGVYPATNEWRTYP